MSRDDGFAVADMDSGYFEDAKMRDLWQRLRDPDQMARATCLHTAVLLASWRQGERVTVAQACPLWLALEPVLIETLKAAKLLDRTGKIPHASFTQWFGAAFARREIRREAGRMGGQASGFARSAQRKRKPKQPSTDGKATVQQPLNQPSTVAEPVRPSVRPTEPTEPTGGNPAPPSLECEPSLDAYQRFYPTPSRDALRFLDELTSEFGQEWVARAIGQAGMDGRGKLLTRAKGLLVLWARQAEKDEAQAEKARNAAKRAPMRPLQVVAPEPELTEAEIAAVVAAYREAK
jgi:hypothetical protein